MIGADGAQLGIMSARDALNLAAEKNLDLVKIAPQATPPVCKIIDYGKYRFEQAKREKEAKKNFESYAKSIHKEKAVKVKALSLKKNKKNGRNLYYEVIFENDKGTGFSLLSADERVDKLLCYSENGSISDTSFNKSLKYCLELVELYVEEQTQKELDKVLNKLSKEILAGNVNDGDRITLDYFEETGLVFRPTEN